LHQYQHIYLESPGHGFFAAVSISQLETKQRSLKLYQTTQLNQNNTVNIKHINSLSKPVTKICNSVHEEALMTV
jgi:hypothetical protein